MVPLNAAGAAPAIAGGDPCKIDLLGQQINSENTTDTNAAQPLIDRHGHRHSEAVLRNWSPTIIRALDIRRVEPDEAAGGAV